MGLWLRRHLDLKYPDTSALAPLLALAMALILEQGAECSSRQYRWDAHSTSVPLLHKNQSRCQLESIVDCRSKQMRHPPPQYIPYDIGDRQNNKATPLSTQMGYRPMQNRQFTNRPRFHGSRPLYLRGVLPQYHTQSTTNS